MNDVSSIVDRSAEEGLPAKPSKELSVAVPQRKASLGVGMLVAAIVIVVLGVYWETTLSMVSTWERAETFAHGFAVLPIFFYLIWRQRRTIDSVETKPFYPAVIGVASAVVLWLLGESVSAVGITQFAVIAMIPLAVWAIFGSRLVAALAIPLAFLFFAVPFGAFLIPTLMDWTADFTVAAIRLSGVPVYREANFISIPSGNWAIVEACSGLRYLIASLMVGCLYAYVAYRSLIRRLAFIAASIIVPIIANWVRAYMIVMLGHLSNNRLASGVDHLIYGWIFFGVVMAFLFWVASFWREETDAAMVSSGSRDLPSSAPTAAQADYLAVVAVGIAIAIGPVADGRLIPVASGPVNLSPLGSSNGWVVVEQPLSPWRPDLSGERAELRQTFEKDGERVAIEIAFFRGQTKDAKAITTVNRLVRSSNLVWRLIGAGTVSAHVDGGDLKVQSATVVGGNERLAAWQWYWVDGHLTSNDYAAKMYQGLSVIRGHGDPVAWVIIYTTLHGDESRVQYLLQSFISEMWSPINSVLKQASE